jgi:hypothetical protein
MEPLSGPFASSETDIKQVGLAAEGGRKRLGFLRPEELVSVEEGDGIIQVSPLFDVGVAGFGERERSRRQRELWAPCTGIRSLGSEFGANSRVFETRGAESTRGAIKMARSWNGAVEDEDFRVRSEAAAYLGEVGVGGGIKVCLI